VRHDLGDRLGIAESLIGLAAAVLPAEPADAARLVGAAESLRSGGGAVPTPRQQADVELALAAAAGAGTVEGCRAEGTALPQEQAVELALRLSGRFAPGGTT